MSSAIGGRLARSLTSRVLGVCRQSDSAVPPVPCGCFCAGLSPKHISQLFSASPKEAVALMNVFIIEFANVFARVVISLIDLIARESFLLRFSIACQTAEVLDLLQYTY